ncbi:pentatricopeptide repeat-containing protein At4g39530-like isoform X2 [Selaginella moellendorffii]|uniref:pentatricopeptide repeat-containing protein At4g39530-like isoform X2 n=1 Tax=Selaginella moellendorffii TaxID=88036 RepID=UPI000D1CA434|nr:pentatricopeptide repeat-containing protein At4g39530-like isoform X2 [Selaginella moellendorffii]|eukprot:XP_024528922.1 pentatricopeptide repeat-containing protein At4g39530-like isoform X2 [Selaginella moellendorffii]
MALADRCEQIHALLSALKSCHKSRNLEKGQRLHSDAIQDGDESNQYFGNGLLSMYGKCGSMVDAQQVFDAMPSRDVVSWNALIAGYAENGDERLGLEVFSSMQREGYKPDARSFVAVLKALASLAAAEEGREIEGKLVKEECLKQGRILHSQARISGYESNVFLANTLVDMYAKCGSLVDARRAFASMPRRSVVSWNAMLLGCADNGEAEEGMRLFESMQIGGSCEPDARTFVAALKNCSIQSVKEEARLVDGMLLKLESLKRGMAIHAEAARRKHDLDGYVTSSLVDMYAKCGSLGDARKVFEGMPYRSVVAWNALLLGCVENREAEMALELFSSMQSPDALSFVAALKACILLATTDGDAGRVSLERGMAIHTRAAKLGYDSETNVLGTLADLYSKCGSFTDAMRVFHRSSRRHRVLWNTLILSYVDSGEPELALEIFLRLRANDPERCAPDARTFAAALKACGSVVSMEISAVIHADILRRGLEKDGVLVTCLVDACCRCGRMVAAQHVVDALVSEDLIAWNALLTGYSRHGDHERVLELFERMRGEGLEPDSITFMAVLSACGHCGLVERGKRFFKAMVSNFRIQAEIEHYHCMVDIFGRANRLGDALETVRSMPFRPTAVTWTIVLGACRKWKDVVVGRLAFESLLAMNEADTAAYMLMGNIYASRNMWTEKAENVQHKFLKV